ncbi:dual OB domain-containing protein [Pseudomonas kribbensis]|uniref:dual OB domain-containing protein n=1 Tax=Pseudomonas kribbensis TaxID=1628086 RepID=UPI003D76A740
MPPYQHQFVCLASSKKPGGRCVAGKIWGGDGHGSWIRPVSNRENDSISDPERTYANGLVLQHLDITSVTFSNLQNHQYQIENHVICHPPLWTSASRVGLEGLAQLVDTPQHLWEPNYHSTGGVNDRVPPGLLTAQRQSLYLIRPESASVRVSAEGADFGDHRLKVRATFRYNQRQYALKITDIQAENDYLRRGAGTYQLSENSYFTVSLGDLDPRTGYAYKLVAAIL